MFKRVQGKLDWELQSLPVVLERPHFRGFHPKKICFYRSNYKACDSGMVLQQLGVLQVMEASAAG